MTKTSVTDLGFAHEHLNGSNLDVVLTSVVNDDWRGSKSLSANLGSGYGHNRPKQPALTVCTS